MGLGEPEQLGHKLSERPIPETGQEILNAFGRRDWKSIPVDETVTESPKNPKYTI